MARCFFFILLLSLSPILPRNVHAWNQTECNSLISFSLSIHSSPSLNWTSPNCCHWDGITCNQGGWVTHLQLPSRGLKLKGSGTLAAFSSLGYLTHLIHLNLSHNSLYGSLNQTGFFSSLSRLEILDLSNNNLYGELQLYLPSINILRMLDISSNRFHGKIPPSFFLRALKLTSFSVRNNTFTGPIPSSICLHDFSPSIRLLDFSLNKFIGNISPELGKCPELKVFRAGNNNLSGLLPEDLYNITTLEEFALPANSLYGVISNKIANLTKLKNLDLNSNNFTGILPTNFGRLSNLKSMVLHTNLLEGVLPSSLMNCTNLEEMILRYNNFEGDISALNFSRFSKLTKLDLMQNQFTGMLPTSLYSCKSLKAVRLSYNDIEGQIQPEILSLKSLSFLSLAVNKLTNFTGGLKILMGCENLVILTLAASFTGAEIPANITIADSNQLQLQFLDLSFNELTGQIPAWILELKNLAILKLNFNRITGPIPSWLGTLPRLMHINFASNQISGGFPKELCRLPMLVSGQSTTTQVNHHSDLELPIYYLNFGSQQPQSVQYNYLTFFTRVIALQNNSISGTIPVDIGKMQHLQQLDLSFNNFSRTVPTQISDLKELQMLRLAMNNFSGSIPSSLASLNFLQQFNVSYNNLEGPIPTSTQLQSFDASAFVGNPKLCGAPLPYKCRRPVKRTGANDEINNQLDEDNEHESPWFYVTVVLGFMIGFLGVCGSLVLNKAWRYSYFRFLGNVYDTLYVMIVVRVNKMKRMVD